MKLKISDSTDFKDFLYSLQKNTLAKNLNCNNQYTYCDLDTPYRRDLIPNLNILKTDIIGPSTRVTLEINSIVKTNFNRIFINGSYTQALFIYPKEELYYIDYEWKRNGKYILNITYNTGNKIFINLQSNYKDVKAAKWLDDFMVKNENYVHDSLHPIFNYFIVNSKFSF